MPPAAVNFGAGNVVHIGAGVNHNCVLVDTNKVRCWGGNGSGQLGYGHTNNIGDGPGEMPPPDVNLGPGVITKLSVIGNGACVLFENGSLGCWGRNAEGQLGQGTVNHIGDGPGEMPPALTDYGAGVIGEIEGALGVTQLVMDDGTLRNWGAGLSLGYGSINSVGDGPGEMPPAAVDLGDVVTMISRGRVASHT
jgi:hypothetical protein